MKNTRLPSTKGTLYTAHCTLSTVHYTLYTSYFSLHTVHRTPPITGQFYSYGAMAKKAQNNSSHIICSKLQTPPSYCIMCPAHCTLLSAPQRLNTSVFTLHTSHFIVHTIHFTLHAFMWPHRAAKHNMAQPAIRLKKGSKGSLQKVIMLPLK